MEHRSRRVRFWIYWISAAVSTLVFLNFMATMLMVPGIMPSTKIWMLLVTSIALAISLGVGTWRFDSIEAPAMIWPLGPVVGMILLLELVYSVINVFLLTTKTHL